MYKYFRSYIFPQGTILILLAALYYGCTGSDQNYHDRTAVVYQGAIISDIPVQPEDPSYDHSSYAIEISSGLSHRNVVIPGRASRSSDFTPGIDFRLQLGGASLHVPGEGIRESITLSVTGLLEEDLPPLPAEIINVTKGYYAGYRFLPHGMIFDSAATIKLEYDEDLVPPGYSPGDIFTFWFDDTDNIWKTLERDSSDSRSGLIISSTDHFTDMINGIIAIPESPQTGGFVPTTLKDIKVAEPSAGITLIEPPVANSEGDATISFPLKLPAGRNGLQPQLALTYSSDMGSGWTGYGWDMSVPSISADLSWGVPRYDPDRESETYLAGGSQLTPVAHRGDFDDRESEKRFYPRREAGFEKIVRHGNSPSGYWWEVTAKDGIRNFYGGSPAEGVIAGSVSADASGNIGYWALVETRDLHDNFIRYKYDKPAGSGQELYISEITYTGHGETEGSYKISFLRTDASNVYERKDSRMDARFGFIRHDNQLLRRIDITFNDEPVRSYTLQYEDGVFMKSLLSGVTELNAAGDEFYTHRFRYYNDVQKDDKYVPYGPEQDWALPDDDLKGLILLNPVNFFFDNVSALGGSESEGVSGGLSTTVGLLDGNLATKENTVGGNVTYQSSTNEGFLTLTDLNGDGLPDKVYRKGDKVYYRPNLLSYPSEDMFGDEKLISGIEKISLSKTKGFGGGPEANPLKFFIGGDFSSATTKTSVYLSDFNADGLIDLASNGIVYFNHLDDNGVPVFTESSSPTPNPLYANSVIAPDILPDPAVEQALLEARFPLHDAVKMWKAPFNGTVVINAPVSLVEDTSEKARLDKYKDGVRVSVQHNGNNPLWVADIDSGDYSLFPGPAPNPLSVTRGDRFYFRVQSRFNGSYDKVNWDPEIRYITINNSDTLAGLEDSNRKIAGRYKASEDFVLCGKQYVGLPRDGQVRIRASFSKPATTDSIELSVTYTDSTGNRSVIYLASYTCDENYNDSIDFYQEVIRNGYIHFGLYSTTTIDWSSIVFTPLVEYTRIDNDSVPLTGPDGNPMFIFPAIPDYEVMYNDPVRLELPVVANTPFISLYRPDSIGIDRYSLKLTPVLTYLSGVNQSDTTGFIFAVKKKDEILGEGRYFYTDSSVLAQDTMTVQINKGDTLFLEYYFPGTGFMTNSDTAFVIIGNDTVNQVTASAFAPAAPADVIFGSLYRGWGQFDYKGDSVRTSLPIDESLLKMKDYSGVDISQFQDTSSIGNIPNTTGEVFNMMIPYAGTGTYLGTDKEVYVSAEYISSSRQGEKNVKVEPLANPGSSGLVAVTKVLKTSSESVAGGLSVASYSHSWGEDNITVDMIDMNADRYPDLLSTDLIQYTDVRGGLAGSSVNHSLGDHYSESEAWGVSSGGNFANVKSSNSLTPVPAKGVKVIIGNNFKTNNNAREAEETSQTSFGVSGNFSSNDDHTDQTWLDINGDGLPDKVYDNGQVRLNMGYSFAPAATWNFDAICAGSSLDFGGGLGVDISNGSIVAGIGISKSYNYADITFLDINSDGLPDIVDGENVSFNTGTGFAAPVNWPGFTGSWPGSLPVEVLGATPLEAGESIGESLNAGFTIGIAIPIIFIKICINPNASVNHGVSRALTQLADINGDGMPDILSSDREVSMKVKPSTIFRTNILKEVERPLGASFTLDYLLTPAVYDHPGGKLALASVRVYDGLSGDGVDTTYTTFDYEGGYYDRHERQFYGFSIVRTQFRNTADNNSIYGTVVQKFSNRDYYSKGKMLTETLIDGQGHNQKGSENFYSIRNIHTGESLPESYALSDREPLFAALQETRQYFHAGAQYPQLTARQTIDYDTLGNISSFTDYSSGEASDMYSVSIKYHGNPVKYLYSLPSVQEVSTSEGLRRKSETVINEYGDITRLSKYITADRAALFDMEYDEFGNLTRITHPGNHKGERMWYLYEYDPAVHSYITGITDAYGYSSSNTYDYRWGLPVDYTDMNGQKILYSYDESGRLDTVTGPFELASGKPYTIVFEYNAGAEVPYAHTLHYDSAYDSNIETYSFSDGLGRMVQTKKSALQFSSTDLEDETGFIVSGKLIYDAFGRMISNYQPTFEPAGNPDKYNNKPDEVSPTRQEYDVQDRLVRLILPDGSETKHDYGIGSHSGVTVSIDSLTDALNNISVTYTRANGRKAAIARKTAGGDIITSYGYDGIGELTSITDPLGNISRSEYDMLGRRISSFQPDAGLTEFVYDDAGNMTSKVTASLRSQIPDGGAISFRYDHERLVEVVYPRNIQNRVNYKYGEPGSSFNRAGRIELIEDASGGQEFFYDRLGGIIKTIRTVQLGESDMRTWIWSAAYDTWGRIHSLTYPDGEKLTYSYNSAGNLLKMEGEKLGRTYTYISRLGYNRYEKQVYLKYGNDVEAFYEYEPKLQRLKHLRVVSGNSALMDNDYSYDLMGNILGISDNASPSGDIGGATKHNYSYDELYRLTGASGEYTGKNTSENYTLSLGYDIMGKIMKKEQTHEKDGTEQAGTTHSLAYTYTGPQPGAATSIGERTFTYDASGNPTGWQDTVTNDYRQLAWDEENRLSLISDNGYVSRYVYDASGNRVVKSHGGSQGVYINGAPAGVVNSTPGNVTVYVSPYFVFQNEKFTKHYYNGLTRIASKTGNGEFMNQYRPAVFEITAGGVNYIERQQQLESDRTDFVKASGVPPGPPTMKGINADPLFTGTAYPDASTPDVSAPRGWPRQPVFAPPGGPPGAPVQWSEEITNENVLPGFGFTGNGTFAEKLLYFYHSDHLGSTSYITDPGGGITQFISYMPFGETFAEENSGWDSPYKFNAKEIDSETGLYYYGARYYDPRIATWLGVDPLLEESPGTSPYVYCADNPVKYVDPDGKKLVLHGTGADFKKYLEGLQNLAGGRFDYNVKTGEVYGFSSSSSENSPAAMQIHELISHKGTINVEFSTDKITGFAPREDQKQDAFNGTGIREGTININPTESFELLVKDPSGKKKLVKATLERTILHEQEHARRALNGLAVDYNKLDYNPALKSEGKVPIEELEVLKFERKVFPKEDRQNYGPLNEFTKKQVKSSSKANRKK